MSSAESKRALRTYRMRRRAEHVDDTRRRIVEATVALHGSIGPARTTFMGIAEAAGVTRATVYRHFPDEVTLFAACSAHWLAQQQPPDPAWWATLSDPLERIHAGLSDLYRFYRAGEPMLTRVHRDLDVVPQRHRRDLRAREKHARDVLLAAFPASQRRSAALRGVVGHAVSFQTWRSLCIVNQLTNGTAVDAMTTLIDAMAAAPLPPGGIEPPSTG